MLISFFEIIFSVVFFLLLFSPVEMEPSSPPAVRFKKRKLDEPLGDFKRSLLELSKEDLVRRVVQLKHELAAAFKSKSEKKIQKMKKTSKKKFDINKHKTRNIAIKLMYQGFKYDGFQVQKTTDNTVAQHLTNALRKCCLVENKDGVSFSCTGRTDQTVSAFSQVCTISVRSKLPNPGADDDSEELPYVKMLNGNLPRDIRVIAWSPVPEKFSARFDCRFRNYKYWFPQSGMNIEAMNEAAKHLIGDHDFRNLCKMNVANGVVTFNRTVVDASVKLAFQNSQFNDNEHNMCEFHIRSQGFLWHQIRCIMSVLFLVGEGKEKPDIVRQLCDIDYCPSRPVYNMALGEPLNLYNTEFDPDALSWQYDEEEMNYMLREMHKDWSLHSIKATMLGEMVKDLIQETGTNAGTLDIGHLMEGHHYKAHIPLMSRDRCASLDNRIQHYIKKKKLEIVPDSKTTGIVE